MQKPRQTRACHASRSTKPSVECNLSRLSRFQNRPGGEKICDLAFLGVGAWRCLGFGAWDFSLCVPPPPNRLGWILKFGASLMFGSWRLELPRSGGFCNGCNACVTANVTGSTSKTPRIYRGCNGVTGKTLLGVGGLPSLRHARFRIYTYLQLSTPDDT